LVFTFNQWLQESVLLLKEIWQSCALNSFHLI
jgi:hypothetical protein